MTNPGGLRVPGDVPHPQLPYLPAQFLFAEELADRFGIMSVPFLFVFDGGELKDLAPTVSATVFGPEESSMPRLPVRSPRTIRQPLNDATPAHATLMSLEEIRMAVQTAHSFGKKVNVHARSIESIRHSSFVFEPRGVPSSK